MDDSIVERCVICGSETDKEHNICDECMNKCDNRYTLAYTLGDAIRSLESAYSGDNIREVLRIMASDDFETFIEVFSDYCMNELDYLDIEGLARESIGDIL